MRVFLLVLAATLSLAACGSSPIGSSGGTKVHRISAAKLSKVQYNMLDSVNALRQAAGVAPVDLNSELTAAALAHARDMSVQNRPWNFGSDGSSPIERIQRAGYSGRYLGENIAETFETEIETLSAWMGRPDTRRIILDADARDMGFAWHQESNGKFWWVMELGAGLGASYLPSQN